MTDRISWTAATAAMVLILCAPALWNGFPLIYPDTGGYLLRPLTGTLEMGRSALYGAFLVGGAPLAFWPNVVAQALIVIWVVALSLRTHGLGNRPRLAVGIILALAVTTSLPWFVSNLMPDVLFAAAVLALYLLGFATLTVRDRAGLVALVAFALASHMALLGLGLGLLALALIAALTLRAARPRLWLPAVALGLGLLVAPLSNLLITKTFAFTPGGASFLFNRLVEDGIVTRYLEKACPDPTLKLCAYRADISQGYDDWLWKNDTPFWKLGGWKDYSAEERRIIVATLISDPLSHFSTAISATLEQFVSFKTELATDRDDNSHTIGTFERRLPQRVPQLMAARQQSGRFDVAPLNYIHVPFAALSMLGLAAALVFCRRLGLSQQAITLAVTVFAALVINAAVCGVFSHPADRYQSRLVPLAPLALMIALISRKRDNAA
jgi:hypothetical protein